MSYSILDNVRLVIGDGKSVLENAVLVIKHQPKESIADPIIYVGEAGSWSEHADQRYFDLNGYTLLPGLFNCHNHLDLNLPYLPWKVDQFGTAYRSLVSYRRAAEALLCGVTALRCVGMANGADLAVKKAVEKQLFWGPRIISAGQILIADGGHGWNDVGSLECSGATAFRKAARKQLSAGADFIKIGLTGGLATPNEGVQDIQMSDAEIEAVVEVANNAGKRVAAHLGNDQAIRRALELGVSSIEHAYHLSEKTALMVADAGAFIVPTLCVSHAADYLLAHNSPAYHVEKLRQTAPFHKASIARAIEAGCKIALGTDLLASDPIDGTVATIRELELLVEAGLTPLQAIQAATQHAAELCGLQNETGLLKEGMAADLIAVVGCPDQDISLMRHIALISRGGRLVQADVPALSKKNFLLGVPGLEFGGGTFKKW